MGYDYDSMEDEDDVEDKQFVKKMMNFSLEQIKMRVQGSKRSKENPEQIAQNKQKYEEQKQAASKTVKTDVDDYGVETF